jgi:hypothetical protein
MARQALADAVTDSDAARSRHATINQGLIGAVLNANAKGVRDDEIFELLHCRGGLQSLAEALSETTASLEDDQRALLDRLIAGDARSADESGSRDG